MPKLPIDYGKRALPPSDEPYVSVITGWKHLPDRQCVNLYFDPVDGDYAGVYAGKETFHNTIMLYYTAHSAAMTHKRLMAITASNPGFDAERAFEEDRFGEFVGKRCGVVCKMTEDKRTGVTDSRVHAVVSVAPEHVETAFEETPTVAAGQLICFVDARQKPGKHDEKHQALLDGGVALQTATLDVGDYMVVGNPYTVDTKRSLGELADNLTEEMGRFEAEVRRAEQSGLKLVVLTTLDGEADAVSSASLATWEHPRCRECDVCDYEHVDKRPGICPLDGRVIATGEHILNGMDYLIERYPGTVEFRFVQTETEAAEAIRTILGL